MLKMILQVATALILAIGVKNSMAQNSYCSGLEQRLTRIETSLSSGLNNSVLQPILDKLRELDTKIVNHSNCGDGGSSRIGHMQTYAAPSLSQGSNMPPQTGPGAGIQKLKLRFKVQGRNFPDLDQSPMFGDTTDAYFELFVSTDLGHSKTKVSRSDVIQDKENPDWGTTFEFDFDRSKNQWLQFYVYDNDNLREDETVGRVWISVADYVDKGQTITAKLDKKTGYLIIKAADPVIQNNPTPGSLPVPFGTPASKMLQFKVSANGIPKKDDVGFIQGTSDPYVILTVRDGVNGTDRSVGRSGTVSNTGNPSWGDVFRVQWDKTKSMWLKLKMYDNDNLREDDKLGTAWIELNDYVAKGEVMTVVLPKKGTLTMNHL